MNGRFIRHGKDGKAILNRNWYGVIFQTAWLLRPEIRDAGFFSLYPACYGANGVKNKLLDG
jgi:hypothetical protein